MTADYALLDEAAAAAHYGCRSIAVEDELEDSVALQPGAVVSCPRGCSANGTWVKITLHSVQPCLCRFGNKEAMIRQPSGGEERRRRRQGWGGNAVYNRDGSDRLWLEAIGQRGARLGIHERAVTPYPNTSRGHI